MRARIVIGMVIVVTGVAAWLWIDRSAETDDHTSPKTIETVDEPVDRAATERQRVEPPIAPEPAAETPPPKSIADSPERADPSLDVPELLATRIAELRIEDADSLRVSYGHVSGITGAPIHVDLESVTAFDEREGLVLHLIKISGADVLGVMSMLGGFEHTVLQDKVVLHAKDLEWTDDRRTEVIEPIVPDPNVPTTITVRGRVVDADGNTVPDARLMLDTVVAGRTDASGAYEVEVRPKDQLLTALIPFHQRSAPFHVKGDYGTTLETDFTLGPPAGGVVARVTYAGDELPPDTVVTVVWLDPDGPVFVQPNDTKQKGRVETLVLDEQGVGVCDHVAPGPAFVRLRAGGHRLATQELTVEPGVRTDVTVELAVETLEQRLRTERISFTFTDTDVDDVVKFIAHTKKFDLVLMPSAREGTAAERVTLTADDETVESALGALCAAIGDVTFRFRDGIVLIEPRER